ncbi:hypothetical protein ABZP36_007313 [Zizania latifolia]
MGRGARAAVAVAVLQLAVLLSPPASAAPLSLDFHAASCPQLESIVLSSVQAALQKEIALAAGLLRIFFHDCFPQARVRRVGVSERHRSPPDDAFSRKLEANCTVDPKRLQDLDVITPDAFDNGYYIALTRSQGVFSSDMALIRDPTTAPIVRQFAQDKASFFAQFAKSMIKLSNVPRPGGNVGEIRRRCFRTNGPRLVADA